MLLKEPTCTFIHLHYDSVDVKVICLTCEHNNCSKIFSPSVYLAGGACEAGGVEHGEGPQLGRHHGNTASGVLVRAQKYLSYSEIFCSPAGRYGFVTGWRGAGGPHLARVEHVSHVQRHVVTGRDKCVVADLDTR